MEGYRKKSGSMRACRSTLICGVRGEVVSDRFRIYEIAVYQGRRANFALVVDMNASSKEHQAQDQSSENKHNN